MTPTVACPDCPVRVAPRGLGSHRRNAHGYRTNGVRPGRVPVYGLTGPFICPTCGATAKNAAGLGAHRFRSHGTLGRSHAAPSRLRAARQAGVMLTKEQERSANEYALSLALRGLTTFTSSPTTPERTSIEKRAPIEVCLSGGRVWLARCGCGYVVIGPLRYEVVDALLAHRCSTDDSDSGPYAGMLSTEDIAIVCSERDAGTKLCVLAERFGVSETTISRVHHRFGADGAAGL